MKNYPAHFPYFNDHLFYTIKFNTPYIFLNRMLIIVLFISSYMYISAVLFWKYDFVEWNNYFLYLQSTLCVGLALKDVICDFHVDLSWVDLHGELLSPISFFTDLFHVSLSLPLFLFPLAPTSLLPFGWNLSAFYIQLYIGNPFPFSRTYMLR